MISRIGRFLGISFGLDDDGSCRLKRTLRAFFEGGEGNGKRLLELARQSRFDHLLSKSWHWRLSGFALKGKIVNVLIGIFVMRRYNSVLQVNFSTRFDLLILF